MQQRENNSVSKIKSGSNKTLPKDFETLVNSADAEAIKGVFAKCALTAHTRDFYKQTALHFRDIPLEVMEWLLDQGLAVDTESTYGTPLLIQASFGNYERCRFLIEHGADVHAVDYAGLTPLHAAAASRTTGTVPLVKMLLEHGADPAVHAGHIEDGKTPLLYMLGRCGIANSLTADVAEILLSAQKDSCRKSLFRKILPAAWWEPMSIPAEEWKTAQIYVSRMGGEFEFRKKDWEETYRSERQSAINRLYKLFDVVPAPPRREYDGKSPITVEAKEWKKQYSELWELLVPSSGSAFTMQGEAIRITGRVSNEVSGNGGINWDGEFRKMLIALCSYLAYGNIPDGCDGESVQNAVNGIIGAKGYNCEEETDILCGCAVKWVLANPVPVVLGKVPYKR